MKAKLRLWCAYLVIGGICASIPVSGEVILQVFNNTWTEITEKIPEYVEVGYTALWLPPPQKAGSIWSVGYDLFDPFDLGGIDQNGSVKTRYGTEAELKNLMATAHRFGLRVYFDNIMNHRGYHIPGYDADTPLDVYPGMLPEDFHLQVTPEGFYRAWPDTVNWGSTWEVQNYWLSGLIDISHEEPNANFGANAGDTHPRIKFVRHPNNPEFYAYLPDDTYVGFNSPQITTNTLATNSWYYEEDVGAYLNRSARWLVNETKCDGLRLDAVKHVPGYFFGEQWAVDKDSSDSGYCGQAQVEFNLSRGFNDWDNHRDTVFDTELSIGRNDLMIFGEHMGEPPPYSDYWAAGMRLLDARTHSTLNDRLGNQWSNLDGLDSADYVEGVQMGQNLGIYYAKSHDDGIANHEELHNAFNISRAGLPDIYTDGNRQAETLGESGGAFPRHANTCYLGQWGDNRIPNLVYMHNQFARSWQYPRLSDDDVVAYDRIDKRSNTGMSDADGCVMNFMMNDNYSDGAYREVTTAFPEGAYLWQYSSAGGNFYTQVDSGKIKVIIPSGGYFLFSWRSPEESTLWSYGGGKPLTIYENGSECGWMGYWRYDGPDGDPNFNPYASGVTTNYGYKWWVPRVTSATNLRFATRVDGSAYDVMFKLDGGMDLNGTNHCSGDMRDHPPGNEGSYDVFLGYEKSTFVKRIGPEKFADSDTASNTIGSAGSGSYEMTIGSAGVNVNNGNGANDYDNTQGASFVYHDPTTTTDFGENQFWPDPTNAADQDLWIQAKVGHAGDINRVYLYYTIDGETWPEGAGGESVGNDTYVTEMYWTTNWVDGDDTNDWWKCSIAGGFPADTVLRYKIGACRQQDGVDAAWYCPFPNSEYDIGIKTSMMGLWEINGFNVDTNVYYQHNDYGNVVTGLVDGFHVIRSRAFLQRETQAPIYNTFTQPFYLDTEPVQGELIYPAENDTLYDNEYGCVLRTDWTCEKAYFHIEDNDDSNDDAATGRSLGNGTNAAGDWAWAEASENIASLDIDTIYPKEWRFNYSNIPSNGTAVLYVKLAELSSSTNYLDTAEVGHFGEITRNLNASGPGYRMFMAWPQNNGDTVGEGYGMKVYFSKNLWDSDETTVKNRFLITIDGETQGRDNYTMTWDGGGDYHELSYSLPDLYDGSPENVHEIVVTHTNAAGMGVTLTASREVLAYPSSSGPTIQITDPPEYDNDGARYQIILPDVAAPAATDRMYQVTVQTDTTVEDVWISFTNNSSGYITPVSATNYLMSNGVTVVSGTNLVLGTNFNTELSAGNKLLIQSNAVTVATILNDTNLLLRFNWDQASETNVAAYRIGGNPTVEGSAYIWKFWWTNMTKGSFTFVANATTNTGMYNVDASATRNATVLFREMVNASTNDLDDDDDGIMDTDETTSVDLPESNPESWTNEVVHQWYSFGKTDPVMPDTDGDLLPDGLELGFRMPTSGTDTNTDTNGDGYPNFIVDLDPPVYNTVPDNSDMTGYNLNASRTSKLMGSTTDPNNPDSDYDGIKDGIEDANRNGWVDGDNDALPVGYDPWPGWNYPDGVWDMAWTETSPNLADSDGDGVSDGYGEDYNLNGYIAGDSNSNRVYDPGEEWTETDPLNPDTDDDGLPDGWEQTYNLNPWNDGVVGHTNMYDATLITTNTYGPDGNPDGDVIVDGLVTNPYTNIREYENGTNPRYYDPLEPPPEGSITIGQGAALGDLTGLGTQYTEFTDWTSDDVLALDEYEGAGNNSEGGDIYRKWDEWDDSRDLIAFYARDGGTEVNEFYFRVDLHDLKAHAEEGNVDFYIVIDTGNPAAGEMALPDEVDCVTSMKWEAVVAVYDSGNGAVYVDTDREHNTTESYQNLYDYGVIRRDQSDPLGFIEAYFNSDLDAVEFSIRRTGLTDSGSGAGWNGLDPGDLNFQVYSVADGTCNTCGDEGGAGGGDIGGRPDIRDAIYNDYIAEDFWNAQAGLPHVLMYWIDGDAEPNLAKVATLIHGNQAIQPGSTVQSLINNGEGGGYGRPLGAHELFEVPLNLHITPTLASAMEWAKTDPADTNEWRKTKYASGPLFNDWIAELYATNLVYLFASTFSDHMMPYFTTDYNDDNIALAQQVLYEIYGFTPDSNTVFWTPERVLDSDTFAKIRSAGYQYTCIDQLSHIWNWFGRDDALGTPGYRINKMEDVDCFVINNGPSDVAFENYDNGLPIDLRNLLIRKGLESSTQDQLVNLFTSWEDYADTDNANGYDVNLRWIANHQWIQSVGLEEIASDRSFGGYTWWSIERGTALSLSKQSHTWINHASDDDFDNWYLGGSYHEGLQDKYFDIRPGTAMTNYYGMLYTPGIIASAWDIVDRISDTDVSALARAALHASTFETAFHDEDENDLSRWSTGDFIYPATNFSSLASFSKIAQSQSRFAAVYEQVDQWVGLAASVTTPQTLSSDVDLDGEDEYIIYNDRLFILLERIGGRIIGVWVRDILNGGIYQAAGNLVSYAGSENETEGTYNAHTNGTIGAYRTSLLKDWWADTSDYVNDIYTAAPATYGWQFTSSDGYIEKTISIAEKSWLVEVSYSLSGDLSGTTLYVRNGFSPNLYDLLTAGQDTLGALQDASGVISLENTNYNTTVITSIGYADGSHSAGYVSTASDRPTSGVTFHTMNMRNQAQTHQVELSGTSSFSFSLGFRALPSDWNQDGMPNDWVDENGLATNVQGGASQDADADGVINKDEYVAGTDPNLGTDYLHVSQAAQTNSGIRVRFPTKSDREYYIWYEDATLVNPDWSNATPTVITGTGGTYEWIDDGTHTDPDPMDATNRFYKIQVQLPQ